MTVDARGRAEPDEAAPRRPRRLDAARNYDALVAAAREEFQENGTDAPLKAVARRAGVGIATLYRNFPTRTALLEAVYAGDVADTVDALCRTAGTAQPVGTDAEHAWRTVADWLDRFTRTVAEDAALREVFSPEALCLSPCREALSEAVTELLAHAGTALPAHRGAEAETFLRAVVSLAVSPFLTGGQREHALSLLLDGLRRRGEPVRGAGPPLTEERTEEQTEERSAHE
ncbi:TetR/AcrR family transcriptional regulator [Streptomyces sp. Ru62]|uniref:TetR/AcrR family transcriptional regulator n=1 Tax=Streptomyces sp. Ru62 TaxID=2080745 RepID=UPI0015E3D8DC|nr:TetR/AcrR family transcriptional regulator [Streptomyces sp. Ru62]